MPRWKNGSKARAIEGGASTKRNYRTSKAASNVLLAQAHRSQFPASPCPRCGAARFCEHRGPEDV